MNWRRLILGLLVIFIAFNLAIRVIPGVGEIEYGILAVIALIAAAYVVRSSRRRVTP